MFERQTKASRPLHCQSGGDGQSGLEENGRRRRRRRRPVGVAVATRVSDERSEELARQDERQPSSRSPRPAARLVHHRPTVEIDVFEKHIGLHMIRKMRRQMKASWKAGLHLYQCKRQKASAED